MSNPRGNPNQYLKRIRETWYVSIKVPRPLQKAVGNTHIRQSLRTKDSDEANRLKHPVVATIKAQLFALESGPRTSNTRHMLGMSFADARAIREELIRLHEQGDESGAESVSNLATEKAEQIEALYGFPKAKKWHKAATRTTDTLSELMEQWLVVSDWRESTKAGHRKALSGVLAFLDDEAAGPADVTRQTAIAYIDTDLTKQALSYSTIRDRLVSMGSFWNWLASRDVVAKADNPWTGHKLSRAAHKGRSEPKRAFTEDEVLALLKGTDRARTWPTWSYLPDIVIIGLYSACRLEEICSLRSKDVEDIGKGKAVILNIPASKTQAGIRPVALTASAVLEVIRRRLKQHPKGHLFPELKPGGIDSKYSFSAVKSFGRYRRACGVPDGTDFHSFRRTAITALEHQGVRQVLISRFVGHKVGTLAADTYSRGGSKEQAIDTAKKIVHGTAVDKAARAQAKEAP